MLPEHSCQEMERAHKLQSPWPLTVSIRALQARNPEKKTQKSPGRGPPEPKRIESRKSRSEQSQEHHAFNLSPLSDLFQSLSPPGHLFYILWSVWSLLPRDAVPYTGIPQDLLYNQKSTDPYLHERLAMSLWAPDLCDIRKLTRKCHYLCKAILRSHLQTTLQQLSIRFTSSWLECYCAGLSAPPQRRCAAVHVW